MQKTWCEEVEEAEMVEQEAAWKLTPRKRRTKVRNVCGEAKTSRISTDGQADQEKAFDRVEHNFLWKVMERFGFSAGFTTKIAAKIKEPLIYGARLDVCSDATPCLMAALHQTKTLCLQQLVDAVGPALTDAQELGSLLGIQSVRVAQRILELWRQRLSGKEKSLITEYSRKTSEPDPKDPFPEILLSPVLEEASGPLLVTCNPTNLSLHKADNKTLYRNCVKSMNRRGLSGRPPLTAWTSRLGTDGWSDTTCMLGDCGVGGGSQ
ncbi:hypothetical protein L3Q82_002591 [Scortum barcoo]|uniref:Uncharacterized protein n=1 Tax=Scortum barcoo TaxID=214431 RepID=A0ACB8VUI6_9TELE|nr:hypothetical protein L3Q82_002591 [Scortum barcoo]